MGNSLQDQLRALGLASSQPGPRHKEKKPARKPGKQPARGKGSDSDGELSLDAAYALRQREEQREAQRAQQKKREEDQRRRALNKAIRQIVSARRQNCEDADIARNFMFHGRIRKVYVTAAQQRALSAGTLGIVYLSGGYHLLEPEALAAVREISAEHVVDLGLEAVEDDPEHPVPDDLVW
jgi:uncharacterized protein YaiL (DUF2058 family)